MESSQEKLQIAVERGEAPAWDDRSVLGDAQRVKGGKFSQQWVTNRMAETLLEIAEIVVDGEYSGVDRVIKQVADVLTEQNR